MNVLCLFDTGVDRAECHQLIGLKQAGVNPYVICKPGTARIADLRAAGIEVEPIEIRSKVDLALIRRLRQLMQERRFDLIHAFRKRAMSNYSLAMIGQKSPPVIAYRGIIGNLSYWDPFAWLTFLNPRVRRIICVCEAVRKYFLQKRLLFFFSLFDEKKVVRIYKGHRVEWYAQPGKSERILGRFGIPESARVIGCISRIKARKGIRELIQAMELLKTDQEVHLVILGRIEDSHHRQALEHSPCRDRIHLLGFHPDAAQMAAEFDVITLPSLRREGLPRAVIEGMSQAIPPVVTDAGGSPELVEDGVSGLVVPPGDPTALARAFDALLRDEARRQAMGVAARQRIIERFSVDDTVKATLVLYREVLAESLPES